MRYENAKEPLIEKDTDGNTVYVCAVCGKHYGREEGAESCCADRICECGTKLANKKDIMCQPCGRQYARRGVAGC